MGHREQDVDKIEHDASCVASNAQSCSTQITVTMEAAVCVLLLILPLVEPQLQTTDRPGTDLWDVLREKEDKCGEEDTTDCSCDPLCARYGDCCKNSQYFIPEEQRLGASTVTCTSFGFYIIASCPRDWKDHGSRTRCLNPDITYRDLVFDAPVVSLRTNIIYRNSYCAVCNDDFDPSTDEVWPVEVQCNYPYFDFLSLNTTTLLERIKYDDVELSWIFNATGIEPSFFGPQFGDDDKSNPHEKLYKCKLKPVPPRKFDLRRCDMDVISRCAKNWTDIQVKNECEGYTARMCFGNHRYRNYHCARCNNVLPIELCDKRISFFPDSQPFSVLINWRDVRDKNPCNKTQVYDPLSKSCRIIHLPQKANVIDSCAKMAFIPQEYVLNEDNMSVYVIPHNKTYQEGEFIVKNDSLYMCVQQTEEIAQDSALQLITMVGLSLSIIFLILHLTVFIATRKIRNLSNMNLASLSVSLLFLYSTFVTSGFLEPRSTPCVVYAVLIHYSLIASFCWMLVIGFDIWRAIRQATTRLILTSGMQGRRFCLYSAFGWSFPALIVSAALITEHTNQGEHFAPGYGLQDCWFHDANALLVFVVTPLAVVMCSNIVFFSWSAYYIHSTTMDITMNRNSTYTDFRFYMRLAFIMGVTWVTGLIAGYVNNIGIWYVFVLFNTLQGLFIFIAFTCRSKVWKELKGHTSNVWCPWSSHKTDGQTTNASKLSTIAMETSFDNLQ